MSRNQAVRRKTSGEHIDLAGAVIPYSNLSDTNLSSANFDGTNLSHSDLSGTDLSGASLVGAVLTHANLSNTNLSHANLSRANLAGADLTGANLTGADMDQADLGKAKLQGAALPHVRGVSWGQFLDAYIDEHTVLPEELSVEALYETLDHEFRGYDLRVEFGEEDADRINLLVKLQELARGKTVHDFGHDMRVHLLTQEFEENSEGRSFPGLSDEPGEYKDE